MKTPKFDGVVDRALNYSDGLNEEKPVSSQPLPPAAPTVWKALNNHNRSQPWGRPVVNRARSSLSPSNAKYDASGDPGPALRQLVFGSSSTVSARSSALVDLFAAEFRRRSSDSSHQTGSLNEFIGTVQRHVAINAAEVPPGWESISKDGVLQQLEAYAHDIGLSRIEPAEFREIKKNKGSPLEILQGAGRYLNKKRYGIEQVVPLSPLNLQETAFDAQNAHHGAMLSQLVYRTEAEVKTQLEAWGYDLNTFTWIQGKGTNGEADTQGFIVAEPSGAVACVFRGTESASDIWTDANIRKEQPTWISKREPDGNVQIHSGFSNALGDSEWQKVEAGIKKAQKNEPNSDVFFFGHSLGGALAQLAAYRWAGVDDSRSDNTRTYTYGSPRVGNEAFRNSYNATVPRSYRLVNYDDNGDQDLVTQVPPKAILGFQHAGEMIRLKDDKPVEIIASTDAQARSLLSPEEFEGENASSPPVAPNPTDDDADAKEPVTPEQLDAEFVRSKNQPEPQLSEMLPNSQHNQAPRGLWTDAGMHPISNYLKLTGKNLLPQS